ncbi:MAG TPA: hypothetical protein VFZ67_11330 [Nitrososphaera sp.]
MNNSSLINSRTKDNNHNVTQAKYADRKFVYCDRVVGICIDASSSSSSSSSSSYVSFFYFRVVRSRNGEGEMK